MVLCFGWRIPICQVKPIMCLHYVDYLVWGSKYCSLLLIEIHICLQTLNTECVNFLVTKDHALVKRRDVTLGFTIVGMIAKDKSMGFQNMILEFQDVCKVQNFKLRGQIDRQKDRGCLIIGFKIVFRQFLQRYNLICVCTIEDFCTILFVCERCTCLETYCI